MFYKNAVNTFICTYWILNLKLLNKKSQKKVKQKKIESQYFETERSYVNYIKKHLIIDKKNITIQHNLKSHNSDLC